ncbi:hypothetical protein SY2F82_24670 [Streptomyces sp. Y2F8-2]|nr:hypothetical protein SY2F82_24670 [Streptomyces sp. Y2F8-2]
MFFAVSALRGAQRLQTRWRSRENRTRMPVVIDDSSIAKKAPRLATIRKGRITVKENAAP